MQSLSWLQWSWELPDPNPLATEPLLCKTRTVADRRQLLHLSTFAIFTCHANYWRFCFILWMMHIFCHFCLYIIKLYIYYIYLYVYRLQYLRCLCMGCGCFCKLTESERDNQIDWQRNAHTGRDTQRLLQIAEWLSWTTEVVCVFHVLRIQRLHKEIHAYIHSGSGYTLTCTQIHMYVGGDRTKWYRTKWHGQNGTGKMVYGQNGMGQNGMDKMVWTKWYGQIGSNFSYRL